MSWFTKKVPKALIAGMYLTRDEAQILTQACQELECFMTRQTEEIEAFPKIKGSDHARRAMKTIRQRHHRIHDRLDDLRLRLRNNHSKGPLRKELKAVARSMARKRLLWDDLSRSLEIGWKAASERYWPRIAENYATLLEILGSFKQDLKNGLRDEFLWSDEASKWNRRTGLTSLKSALKGSSDSKPKSTGKHVFFEETYRLRVFGTKDAPKKVGEAHADAEWHVYGRVTDFGGKLASEEKYTTKYLQARVHERRRGMRTDARSAARYLETVRQAEASGGEERREAKRRETGPVFERARVETRRRRTRSEVLFDDLQETRWFVPL